MKPSPKHIWVSRKETITGPITGYKWPCVFDHPRDGAQQYILYEHHIKRTEELLEANNKMLQRARDAEDELRNVL